MTKKKKFADPGDPGVVDPLPTRAGIRVSLEEMRKARLFVCSEALAHAGSVDLAVVEAREMFDALGLR